MKHPLRAALFAAGLLAFALPAAAQDHSGHAMTSDETMAFPEVCRSDMAMPASPHDAHGGMAMADHQKEAMAGMMTMDRDMMQGMMKEDADVAFVCGMIAHHQGAIDMSRVELQYGNDPWAKEMAQKVIDAQTAEIADMKAWLEKNAK